MIDKLVKLKNGLEYIVINQTILDKKIYVFARRVDSKAESILNDYLVCQVNVVDGKVFFEDIEDKELLKKLNNIFISELKQP